ncbi:MAG: c-type cytochrome [Gemmatimonadaceae bacterium]
MSAAAPAAAAAMAALVALAACAGDIDRADQAVDSAVVLSEQMLDSAGDSLHIEAVDLPPGLADSVLDIGPPVILVADSAAGDSLFHGIGRCMTCHAGGGAGVASLGSSLRDEEWQYGSGSITSIRRVILEGAVPANAPVIMPAFASRFTALQAYQVAAYVYALSHPGAVVADTAFDGGRTTQPTN